MEDITKVSGPCVNVPTQLDQVTKNFTSNAQ